MARRGLANVRQRPVGLLALLVAMSGTSLAAPVAAFAQPTLSVNRPCYSTGDAIAVAGAGYTPAGKVALSLTGARVELKELVADVAGNLRATFDVRQQDVDTLLPSNKVQGEVFMATLDRALAAAKPGVPAGASVRYLLSRFGTDWNQRDDAFEPRRRLVTETVGFTGHAGRMLYLHYLRGGRRVATVPLGRLRGPCGTLRKTLAHAFPMRHVARGKWRLAFTLSRTDPGDVPGYSYGITVT